MSDVVAGPRPIEAVGTSTAAFVGVAPEGPVKVRSLAEYERVSAGESPLTDAVRLFFAGGGREAWVAPDVTALDAAPDIALLALPGETDVEALRTALSYADARRAFLIVDPPGEDPDGALALVDELRGTGSANAAVYFPRLAGTPSPQPLAPSGAVAAVYARTDVTRGVWAAPAGLEAVLTGIREPLVMLDDATAATLNDRHVNAIRSFPGRGTVLWGARTVAGPSSEWKYVPVRRLGLHLERSLDRGLEWAVFEPNDELLWAKVRAQVGEFMLGLFRAGAFAGRTPAEAFLVKCDEDTMTQDDLTNGRLVVLVGFAALKPTEFVVFRIDKLLAP